MFNFKENNMNRFTVTFDDKEYEALQSMIRWYYKNHGLKVSKCSLIKHILFAKSSDLPYFEKSEIPNDG